MLDAPIFISHASADDAFVKALREKLELFKVGAWVDSRQLRVGDPLEKNIQAAITAAPHFIVILSTNAINSKWVPKEIKWAEEVRQTRENYRLIPILLSGIKPSSLSLWFQEEPRAKEVAREANGLNEAFSAILAALDMQEANDPTYPELIQQAPIEELQLRLTRPSLETREGKHTVRWLRQ